MPDTFKYTHKVEYTQGGVEMPAIETIDPLPREMVGKLIRNLILGAGAAATAVTFPTTSTHAMLTVDKLTNVAITVGAATVTFPVSKPTGATQASEVGWTFPIPAGATLTLQNQHATLDCKAKILFFG